MHPHYHHLVAVDVDAVDVVMIVVADAAAAAAAVVVAVDVADVVVVVVVVVVGGAAHNYHKSVDTFLYMVNSIQFSILPIPSFIYHNRNQTK